MKPIYISKEFITETNKNTLVILEIFIELLQHGYGTVKHQSPDPHPLVSSLPKTVQIRKNFKVQIKKKTQLFDVIHGEQHVRYLKAYR